MQQRIVAARKGGVIDDVFLLCEHPHVITLGRTANRANLLASQRWHAAFHLRQLDAIHGTHLLPVLTDIALPADVF